MQAVISGRAGVALIRDGDGLHTISDVHPDQLVPCQIEDWDRLFSSIDDLQYLENCQLEDVRDALEDAVDQSEALDVALSL